MPEHCAASKSVHDYLPFGEVTFCAFSCVFWRYEIHNSVEQFYNYFTNY